MTDIRPNSDYTYDQACQAVVSHVEEQLTGAPLVIRRYTSHLASSRGKYVRAQGLLACSMNREGGVGREAVTLAAALELLHLATLVHDDVIDNADTRRGIATLQKQYGKRIAVICGDYLLTAAIRLAASIEDKEQYGELRFPDYISRICMGELRQEMNHKNLDLSLYRYLSIINGKTAALFEAAFYGGGVLAKEEGKRLSLYGSLGRCTGMIFQLMDDCIDYERDQEEAGKNVGSDYGQGVITLPLIYALKTLPGFYEKVKKEQITPEAIYSKVRGAGGPDFVRMVAGKYYKKALSALDTLDLPMEKKQLLTGVLDKAYYGLKK